MYSTRPAKLNTGAWPYSRTAPPKVEAEPGGLIEVSFGVVEYLQIRWR